MISPLHSGFWYINFCDGLHGSEWFQCRAWDNLVFNKLSCFHRGPFKVSRFTKKLLQGWKITLVFLSYLPVTCWMFSILGKIKILSNLVYWLSELGYQLFCH